MINIKLFSTCVNFRIIGNNRLYLFYCWRYEGFGRQREFFINTFYLRLILSFCRTVSVFQIKLVASSLVDRSGGLPPFGFAGGGRASSMAQYTSMI
jgi:hypothetical protein